MAAKGFRATTATAELRWPGVRIVDFTAFWAGPAATHSLAAFGADVIKIESIQRPDGIRYSGGMRTDVDDWWEYGWVFHAMNTNKRSVTLDLESEDGIRLFKQLVSQADAVIENFSPRVMDQFGLGADALLELKPDLVVVRMPAFGLTGPWRDRVGFAPTMEQIAGLGVGDRPARGAAGPTARRLRPACGRACGIRVAGRTRVRRPHRPRPTRRGADDRDRAERDRRSDNGIRGLRDGPGAARQPRPPGSDAGHLPVRGRRQLDRGQRRTPTTQRNALAELTGGRMSELGDWLARRTADAVVGTPCERRHSGSRGDLAVAGDRNPQLRHRGFFERLEHPRTGAGLYPTSAVRPLDGADRWLHRPPPTLGQHNAEVLTRAVWTDRCRPASGSPPRA